LVGEGDVTVAALLFAVGFAFQTIKDPFTDKLTYIAQSGPNDGPMLAVLCGAETDGEMVVMAKISGPLYHPEIDLIGKYPELVRFDDGDPIELGFRYDGRSAYLTKREAARFVSEMKLASKVTFALHDYRNEEQDVRVLLTGAADSVARVEAACKAR
jgi:hypothetical protein